METKHEQLTQTLEILLTQYGATLFDNPAYCRNFLRDQLGPLFPEEAACMAAIAFTGYTQALWQALAEKRSVHALEGALLEQTVGSRFSLDLRQQSCDVWKKAMLAVLLTSTTPEKAVMGSSTVSKTTTHELLANQAPVPATLASSHSVNAKVMVGLLVAMGLIGLIAVFAFRQPVPPQPNPQEAELKAKALELEKDKLKLELQLQQEKTKQLASQKQVPSHHDTQTILVPASELRATASSSIQKTPGRAQWDFTPDQVLDNNYRTTWQEDTSGSGIGEWIQLSFSRPYDITTMAIRNGYAETNDSEYGNLFEKNNRIKDALIVYSNGTQHHVVLQDLPAWQTLQVSSGGTATWVRLRIDGVYKGRKFDDTCISDMQLYGIPQSRSDVVQYQSPPQHLTPTAPTNPYFTVQVASRQSYQDALSISQQIPNSRVYKKPLTNGMTWYAVTVGAFSSKDEAVDFKSQVIARFSHVGTYEDIPKAFVTNTAKFER